MSLVPGDIVYLYKAKLSHNECNRIIKISEQSGKQDTTLDLTESGFRKQKRLKYADYGLTRMIFNKIKDDLEMDISQRYTPDYTLVTYVHYSPGAICPLHTDSKVSNGIGKDKYITVIVYLNDFEGGETYFVAGKGKRTLSVSMGDVLVFHGQKIPHGCNIVKSDKKIIIFGLETA